MESLQAPRRALYTHRASLCLNLSLKKGDSFSRASLGVPLQYSCLLHGGKVRAVMAFFQLLPCFFDAPRRLFDCHFHCTTILYYNLRRERYTLFSADAALLQMHASSISTSSLQALRLIRWLKGCPYPASVSAKGTTHLVQQWDVLHCSSRADPAYAVGTEYLVSPKPYKVSNLPFETEKFNILT